MQRLGALLLLVLMVSVIPVGAAPVVLRVQDPARGEWLTDILKESIALFEAKNPDIKVELDHSCGWAECMEKNIVMAAGGTLPDIVFVYHEARTGYIRNGLLMDITRQLHGEPAIIEAWLPPLREAPKYNNRYYGVPEFWVPYLAHVNLDEFANAGLDNPGSMYSSGAWTVSNLATITPKLTRRVEGSSTMSHVGLLVLSGWVGLLPWAWSHGAEPFSADALEVNLNTPEAKSGYIALNRLVNEVESTTFSFQWSAMKGEWGIALWNLCLYHINKAWNLDDRHDILPMPAGPAGTGQAMTVRQWGISSATKHPDAAWRFLKHLASVEHDSILVRNRQTLPLTIRNIPLSVHTHKDHFNSEYITTVLDVLGRTSRVYPYPLDMAVVNELENQMLPVWNKTKSVDEALAQAQQVISAKIAELLDIEK
jgi:multiple sugar transport system substrate-binding protein